MSITFWCPDAPTKRVQPYPDEPDFFDDESTLPEVTLSNDNARVLLELTGLVPDHCGTVKAGQLLTWLEGINQALNLACYRAPFLEPAVVRNFAPGELVYEGAVIAPTTPGPREISPGRTDEWVVRKLEALRELALAAISKEYAVSWG